VTVSIDNEMLIDVDIAGNEIEISQAKTNSTIENMNFQFWRIKRIKMSQQGLLLLIT
jgi:hypothetical protein